MERLKFEEQFKKQLDSRKMQPSAKSWEQLRSRLDAERGKSRTTYWRLGIAASFIAGALLASLFFNTTNTVEAPSFVGNETEKTEEIQIIEKPAETELQIALEQDETVKKYEPAESQNYVTETIPEKKQAAVLEPDEAVFLEQKVEEIIAGITQKEQEQDSLTQAETDELLSHAMEQIIRERKFKNNVGTVSASALLEDVEDELDRSFRDKIFEMLKNSYLKTKDAVANRNE